jgi:hypothetical protein
MACFSGASVAIPQFHSTYRNFDQQAVRSLSDLKVTAYDGSHRVSGAIYLRASAV